MDGYKYDKKRGVYYDQKGNTYAYDDIHKAYEGPPMALRFVIGLATFIIFWTIASNMTTQNVIFANVNGSSMDYSLLNEQHVMIDIKNEPVLDRDTIIAFSALNEDPLNPRIVEAKANGEEVNYVKRIVALPGETIEGRKDGLYVNGEKLPEPYLANKYRPVPIPWNLDSLSQGQLWADGNEHSVVPEDHVFVMGDNREISEDSRYFGFVHIDSIIGEVKTLPWNDGKQIQKEEQ